MCDIAIREDERLDFINENLSLIQKKHGLTFGTDAYLLAAYVRARPGALAVDLGSGTGVAALLCAVREKAAHIFAVEVQEEFCELIARNAALNALKEAITPLCMDVRDLRPTHVGAEADIVISNPPYMRNGTGVGCKNVQMNIARREIFGGISDFCMSARRLLRYGGLFYTVYRPDRLTDLLSALRNNALEPKRMTFVHPDADSPPCLVLTEAKYGGSTGVMITEPLIIYRDGTRDYTDRMSRIYETCSFWSE